MSEIQVSAQREIAAPAETVYHILSDYRQHHPNILPPAFFDLKVEQGGVGAGTVITFGLKAGGRTFHYRMEVTEPEPGRILLEREPSLGQRTTFTVAPRGDARCLVTIETRWQPRGFSGLIERLFAPRMMRPLYADELQRLDSYARAQVATAAGVRAGG
jgi:uncharacterized protein YndB with AHSA1/START domain